MDGEPAVIRIVVPGTPRGLERNRHRIVRKKDGGQFVSNYLPAQSAATQAIIRKYGEDAMQGRAPLDCPLDVRIAAYMPIPASWSKVKKGMAAHGAIRHTGRPDADNLVKLIGDSLNAVCWRDDSLISDCTIFKRYSERPRVVIEVRLCR